MKFLKYSGCISSDFVGSLVRIDGELTAIKYRDILEKYMLPLASNRMSPGWYFQQDNDPKHRAGLLMGERKKLPDGRYVRLPGWFSLNSVKLLRTPAYSADMNPIEHIWAFIKYRLRGRRFRNGDHCWEVVKKEWEAIPLDKVIDYVNSMPRRLRAVRLAKGGPTKY